MERPDFFSLKNGSKSKLPFSNKEYEKRLLKIRIAMSAHQEKAAQREFLIGRTQKLHKSCL